MVAVVHRVLYTKHGASTIRRYIPRQIRNENRSSDVHNNPHNRLTSIHYGWLHQALLAHAPWPCHFWTRWRVHVRCPIISRLYLV